MISIDLKISKIRDYYQTSSVSIGIIALFGKTLVLAMARGAMVK